MFRKKLQSSLFFLSVGTLTTLSFALSSCSNISHSADSNAKFLYNNHKFSNISDFEDFVFPEIEDIKLKDLRELNDEATYVITGQYYHTKEDLFNHIKEYISLSPHPDSDYYYVKPETHKALSTIHGEIFSNQVVRKTKRNVVSIYKMADGKYTTDKELAINSFYQVSEKFSTKYYDVSGQSHIFNSKEAALNWLQNSLLKEHENVKEIRVYDPMGDGQSLTYNELLSKMDNYVDKYIKVGNQYYNIDDLNNHMSDIRDSVKDMLDVFGVENKQHPGLWNIGMDSGSPGDFIGSRYYSGMTAPTNIINPANWVVDSSLESGAIGQLFTHPFGARESANAKLAIAVAINEWISPDTKQPLNWETFFNRMLYSLKIEYGTQFVDDFKKLAVKYDLFSTGSLAWDDAQKMKGQGIIHSFANAILALFNKVEKSSHSTVLIYYMNRFFKEAMQYFNTVLLSLGFHPLFSPDNDVYNNFYKKYTSTLYNMGGDTSVAINLIDSLLEGSFTYSVATIDDTEIEHVNHLFHAISGTFMQINMMRSRMLQTYKVIQYAFRRKYLEPMPGGGFDTHMQHEVDEIIHEHEGAIDELDVNSDHNANVWLPGRETAIGNKADDIVIRELWGPASAIIVDLKPGPSTSSPYSLHIISGNPTTSFHNANYDNIPVRYLCYVDYNKHITYLLQVETGIVREFKLGDENPGSHELDFAVDGEIRLITDSNQWMQLLNRDFHTISNADFSTIDNFHKFGTPMVFSSSKGGILSKDGNTLLSGHAIPYSYPNENCDTFDVYALFAYDVKTGYIVYDVASNKLIRAKSYVNLPAWFKMLKRGEVRELATQDMLQIQHGQVVDNVWNFHQMGKPSSINDFGGNQQTIIHNLTDKTPQYTDRKIRFYLHMNTNGKVVVFDRQTRMITNYENPQSVPKFIFNQPRRYLSESEVDVLLHGRIELDFNDFGRYSSVVLDPLVKESTWSTEDILKIRHPYYMTRNEKRWTENGPIIGTEFIIVNSSNNEVTKVDSLSELPHQIMLSIPGDIFEVPYNLMKTALSKNTFKDTDFQNWNRNGKIFDLESHFAMKGDMENYLLINSPHSFDDLMGEKWSMYRDFGGPKFIVFKSERSNPEEGGDPYVWLYDRHTASWNKYPSLDTLPLEVKYAEDTRLLNDEEYREFNRLAKESDRDKFLHKISTMGKPLADFIVLSGVDLIRQNRVPYRWLISRNKYNTDNSKITVVDLLDLNINNKVLITEYQSINNLPRAMLYAPHGAIAEIQWKDMRDIMDAHNGQIRQEVKFFLNQSMRNAKVADIPAEYESFLKKNVQYAYYVARENADENPSMNSVYVIDLWTSKYHKFTGVNAVPRHIRNQKYLIRLDSLTEFRKMLKLIHDETDVLQRDYSSFTTESGNMFANLTPEEIWNLPTSVNISRWFVYPSPTGRFYVFEPQIRSDNQITGKYQEYDNYSALPEEIKWGVYGSATSITSGVIFKMIELLGNKAFDELRDLLIKYSEESSVFAPLRNSQNGFYRPPHSLSSKYQTHSTVIDDGDSRFAVDISQGKSRIYLWDNLKKTYSIFKNLHSVPKWITKSPNTLWVTNAEQHSILLNEFFNSEIHYFDFNHLSQFPTTIGAPIPREQLFGHSYLEQPVIPMYYITYNEGSKLFSVYSVSTNKILTSDRLNRLIAEPQLFGTVIELTSEKFRLLTNWHENDQPINFNHLNDGSRYVDIGPTLLKAQTHSSILDIFKNYTTAYRENIELADLVKEFEWPQSSSILPMSATTMSKWQYRYYFCIHNGPKTESDWDNWDPNSKIDLIGVFDTKTGVGSYYTLGTLPKGFYEFLGIHHSPIAVNNGGMKTFYLPNESFDAVRWIPEDSWLSLASGKLNNSEQIKDQYLFQEFIYEMMVGKIAATVKDNYGKSYKIPTKWILHYNHDSSSWIGCDTISDSYFEFKDWFSIPPSIRLSDSVLLVLTKMDGSYDLEGFKNLIRKWARDEEIPNEIIGRIFHYGPNARPRFTDYLYSLGTVFSTYPDYAIDLLHRPEASSTPSSSQPTTPELLPLGGKYTSWLKLEGDQITKDKRILINIFGKVSQFLIEKKLYDGKASSSNLLLTIYPKLLRKENSHDVIIGSYEIKLRYMDGLINNVREFETIEELSIFLQSCKSDVAVSFDEDTTFKILSEYHLNGSWISSYEYKDLIEWVNKSLSLVPTHFPTEDKIIEFLSNKKFGSYSDTRAGLLKLISWLSIKNHKVVGSKANLLEENPAHFNGTVLGMIGSSILPTLCVLKFKSGGIQCETFILSGPHHISNILKYIEKELDIEQIVFVKEYDTLMKLWHINDWSKKPDVNDDPEFQEYVHSFIENVKEDHIPDSLWPLLRDVAISLSMQGLLSISEHDQTQHLLPDSMPHNTDWDRVPQEPDPDVPMHNPSPASSQSWGSVLGSSSSQPGFSGSSHQPASSVSLPDGQGQSSSSESIGPPPPLPRPRPKPNPVQEATSATHGTGDDIGPPPPLPKPRPKPNPVQGAASATHNAGDDIGTPPPLPQKRPQEPVPPTHNAGDDIGTPPPLPQKKPKPVIPAPPDTGSSSSSLFSDFSVKKKRSASIDDIVKTKSVDSKISKIKNMGKYAFKGFGSLLNGLDSIGLAMQFLDGIVNTKRIIYRATLPDGQVVRWNGAMDTKWLFGLIQGDRITLNNVKFRVEQLVAPSVKSSFTFEDVEYASKDEATITLSNELVANPLKFISKYSRIWPIHFKTKVGTTYYRNWRSIVNEFTTNFKVKYTNGYAIYDTKFAAIQDLQNKNILTNQDIIERTLFIWDPKDKSRMLFSKQIPTNDAGIHLVNEINELRSKAHDYIENNMLETKDALWTDINNNKYADYDSITNVETLVTPLYTAHIFYFVRYFQTQEDAIMTYISLQAARGEFHVEWPQPATFSFTFHGTQFHDIDTFRNYLMTNYKI